MLTDAPPRRANRAGFRESDRIRTLELFGDDDPDTKVIRVWTRAAVRKEVTSFATFLSTLCHEFCHHLDFQKFRFVWHTRLLRADRRGLP
jgi:hypothetical protein